MKNFKKAGLFVSVLSAVVIFSACGGKISDNVSVESVFPKDASIVFAIDSSNDQQVKNFNNLMDKFPDNGLFAKGKEIFIKSYNKSSGPKDSGADFTWDEDIAPIFEGEWKFAISMSVPEKMMAPEYVDVLESGEFNEPYNKEFNPYLAAKFENGDAVRDLIEQDDEAEYERVDGVDYWHAPLSDLYVVGYGDLFFATISKKSVDEAVARLKNGGGFDTNQKYLLKTNALAPASLGYYFLDGKIFNQLYKNAFDAIGLKSLSKMFASTGDVFLFLSAEKDGFRFFSSIDLAEGAKASDVGEDTDYKLSLINKVNADGVFLYAEGSGNDKALDYLTEFLNVGFNQSFANPYPSDEGLLMGSDVGEDAEFQPADLEKRAYYRDVGYKVFKEIMDKMGFLLGSPMAFAMSDSGGFSPTMSLYFQLKEGDVEKAKKLLIEMDTYADEVIKIVDEKVAAGGLTTMAGLVKKDLVVVEGGVLHRLYLDFNLETLPESKTSDLQEIFGENFKEDFKLEIYYGLTGDNTFVIAIYPDFPKAFGKNVLSSDKNYLSAVAKLEDNYGSDVFYFRTKPLSELVYRLMAMSGKMGTAPEFELYKAKIKPYFDAVQYMISSEVVSDSGIVDSLFLKIE